jgi:hypothetical protein
MHSGGAQVVDGPINMFLTAHFALRINMMTMMIAMLAVFALLAVFFFSGFGFAFLANLSVFAVRAGFLIVIFFALHKNITYFPVQTRINTP